MKDNRKGIYVLSAVTVLFTALCVWGYAALGSDSPEPETERVIAGSVDVGNVPPASEQIGQRSVQQVVTAPDMELKNEFVRSGGVATQESGERGSLEGAIFTDYPMEFKDSKYERIPDTPLVRFTDEMIWQNGSENDFSVKRDAMREQADMIQEASIALSVSPRVEMGKVLGYRLVEIPQDTLFSRMGLVSGDIVLSINGRMPDMEPMSLMFVNMVAGRQGASTLEVEHRGEKRTIHLTAVD